ncbi:MAG: aminotransferase class I/II-fold pyridoxal phosphate-dependent enzyme [Nannocystaceae bacterium]
MLSASDPVDLRELAASTASGAARESTMAGRLVGSEILKIAAAIRKLKEEGADVCDFTVGDFRPEQFQIPDSLRDGIKAALDEGQTFYPPSAGTPELRAAVLRFYERELGLRYPEASVLIAGGARPLIYGTYRAVVDAGDKVVYPVPSWNNNHYTTMLDARGVAVICGPETRFLPAPEALIAELDEARLVCLCSPLNPSGTTLTEDALRRICEAIVDENRGREARGERPLYLLYDHIYWQLCLGSTRHVTPPALVPEMARFTVFIDGISKAFAGTGIRVGWGLGPVDVIKRMSAIIGHVGAWAPRPAQLASAALLDDEDAIAGYHAVMKVGISTRLDRLHAGIQALREEGLAIDSIPPMGAIYLTVQINPFGKTTPDGATLKTNEDVRRYLLERAKIGIVPFQAFGVPGDDGWFRFSVGAASLEAIDATIPRLRDALQALG